MSADAGPAPAYVLRMTQMRPLHAPSRRAFLAMGASLTVMAACAQSRSVASAESVEAEARYAGTDWRALSEAEWQERLSPAAFGVLRKENTERAFSSPLFDEKRKGTYHCAGCDLALFSSQDKYDSGTGWPSFSKPLEGVMATKPDDKLWMQRTEYHCARCLGHQGHVFDDGPLPTGKRWCNNGVALVFRPAA